MIKYVMGLLPFTVAVIVSMPAYAVPKYDVEGWCRQVASVGGSFSNMMFNGCIEQEQSSYDSLRTLWARVPPQTQEWCDQVARVGGNGSYMMLSGCIEQETNAASSTPKFNY